MSSSTQTVFASRVQSSSPMEEARDEARRQIQKIAEIMEHMNISAAEVAKETNLSRQTVYRVIGGTPAKLETVIAIERAVSSIVRARMDALRILMSPKNGEVSNVVEIV